MSNTVEFFDANYKNFKPTTLLRVKTKTTNNVYTIKERFNQMSEDDTDFDSVPSLDMMYVLVKDDQDQDEKQFYKGTDDVIYIDILNEPCHVLKIEFV